MFKRILVPLDGSEAAEKVLPFVIEEAQTHSAEVRIIRVIAPIRTALRGVPSIFDEAEKKLEEIAIDYLENKVKELEDKGLEVTYKIKHGYPASRIIEYALSCKCDLIILGSHGWTHATRWRFGSVANYIVRAKISTPILIIPT
jgi:nucleotide-binding universal stress UspA family protein